MKSIKTILIVGLLAFSQMLFAAPRAIMDKEATRFERLEKTDRERIIREVKDAAKSSISDKEIASRYNEMLEDTKQFIELLKGEDGKADSYGRSEVRKELYRILGSQDSNIRALALEVMKLSNSNTSKDSKVNANIKKYTSLVVRLIGRAGSLTNSDVSAAALKIKNIIEEIKTSQSEESVQNLFKHYGRALTKLDQGEKSFEAAVEEAYLDTYREMKGLGKEVSYTELRRLIDLDDAKLSDKDREQAKNCRGTFSF